MATRLQSEAKRVVLNLGDDRWAAVIRYAQAAFPGQPLAYGIRELLLISSGLDPVDAAAMAARQAAYNATIAMLRIRVLKALGPLVETLATESARDAMAAKDPEKAA